MPNLKAAKKRVRTSLRNRVRNLRAERAVELAVHNAEKAIQTKQADVAAQVKTAISVIDKTITQGILHRNNGARKKSQLTRKLQALAA